MNRKQLEEMEGFVIHDKLEKALPDAVAECLEKSIERLDKIFLLACEARAAYINARNFHREENFIESHMSRTSGTTKLKVLHDLLMKNLHIDK